MGEGGNTHGVIFELVPLPVLSSKTNCMSVVGHARRDQPQGLELCP